MLLSHIMGMDHIMSIATLALLLLAEVLVAIILIGVSIEICSYGWKNQMESNTLVSCFHSFLELLAYSGFSPPAYFLYN